LRDELVVRRAHEDDLVTVAALHRESIVELCSAAYSPEQIARWIAGRTMERYAKLFVERRMFVCERVSSPSGTVDTRTAGTSTSSAADGERTISVGLIVRAIVGFGILDVESKRVFAVYVAPGAVLGGVGRRLLEAMEEDARSVGIERLELHATLNAARFYERSGYVDEGATKVTLSTGVELDAVRMSKRIVGT
jgi:GNAT superfamily N-acetyltransferase